MRRQLVAQIACLPAPTLWHLLTQLRHLAQQGIDLLLLLVDDLVELLHQVLCEAGFDFQVGQPLVNVLRIHGLGGVLCGCFALSMLDD